MSAPWKCSQKDRVAERWKGAAPGARSLSCIFEIALCRRLCKGTESLSVSPRLEESQQLDAHVQLSYQRERRQLSTAQAGLPPVSGHAGRNLARRVDGTNLWVLICRLVRLVRVPRAAGPASSYGQRPHLRSSAARSKPRRRGDHRGCQGTAALPSAGRLPARQGSAVVHCKPCRADLSRACRGALRSILHR